MNEIIDRCIIHKIPISSYMIMYLLHNNEKNVLLNYCINNTKIETKEFLWMIDNGYLEEVRDRSLIEINDLVLTNKFSSEVLKIVGTKNITFEQAFEQLRDHFPSKAGNSERRLQGDIERCKRLYKMTIIKNGKLDEELHSVILQCINYEVIVRTKGRSLEYFKLLATWLSKEEWKLYYDDVIEIIKNNGSVEGNTNNSNLDAI